MTYFYFDISGSCNANCQYCVTGAKNHENLGFIDLDLFKDILNKISLEFDESRVALYNWGEPFLHPNFSEIAKEFNKYPNVNYDISTNAGIIPELNEEILRSLHTLLFSMSGFSQASYDKIHKITFNTVKRNIKEIAKNVHQYKDSIIMKLSYHIYSFNKDEVKSAGAFAKEMGITFQPYYAFINDLKKSYSYVTGTLAAEELKELEADICFEVFPKNINSVNGGLNKKKKCPIKKFIVINPKGEVLVSCCAPYGDKQFVLGNFLEMDAEKLKEIPETYVPFCDKCLNEALIERFPPILYEE